MYSFSFIKYASVAIAPFILMSLKFCNTTPARNFGVEIDFSQTSVEELSDKFDR